MDKSPRSEPDDTLQQIADILGNLDAELADRVDDAYEVVTTAIKSRGAARAGRGSSAMTTRYRLYRLTDHSAVTSFLLALRGVL